MLYCSSIITYIQCLIASFNVVGNNTRLVQCTYNTACISIATGHPCFRFCASLVCTVPRNTPVWLLMPPSARPHVHDPTRPLVYVTREELLQSLHLTLTGISSSVYVWDSHAEKFRLRAVPHGKKGTLVLIGTDEVISERSVICIAATFSTYRYPAQHCSALVEYRYTDATSGDSGSGVQ